jgi:hypothetical protein
VCSLTFYQLTEPGEDNYFSQQNRFHFWSGLYFKGGFRSVITFLDMDKIRSGLSKGISNKMVEYYMKSTVNYY